MANASSELSQGELTDAGYEIADKVERWLESRPGLHSPSTIARGVGCDTNETKTVLCWLDKHAYLDAGGNGYWRKYQARVR